jgi:thioredoxin-like negative regulator of GroEL
MLEPCERRLNVAGCGVSPNAADRRVLDLRNTGHRGGQDMPAPRSTETAVPTAATERPQLLFFYSNTSGSSRRVEGFLAQVLQRRHNHRSFQLRRIDADRHAQLVERFQIDMLPALVVIENKRVRARLSSPRGCAQISQTLAPWLI